MEPTVREPSPSFARATSPPQSADLFGEPVQRGVRIDVREGDGESGPTKVYEHPNGSLWRGDAVEWLGTLPDASVDVVVADPPYSIKKAEWDTFESQYDRANETRRTSVR
ncbi:hypothetical protein [Rubrivirga sp.]|uniref:hypothetical protein n=1 Tax=Rubrivirga sp. TaxID=1885344 RepID=UPI003B524316